MTDTEHQAPVMRKAGWQVTDDGGENKLNAVRWTVVAPVGTQEVGPDDGSPNSPDSPRGAPGELASQASHDSDLPPTPCCKGGALLPKCSLCSKSPTFWKKAA
jgi:hypothetical protein